MQRRNATEVRCKDLSSELQKKLLSMAVLRRRQFSNLERCEWCQCQKLKICRDVILAECFQVAWFADSNPKS